MGVQDMILDEALAEFNDVFRSPIFCIVDETESKMRQSPNNCFIPYNVLSHIN